MLPRAGIHDLLVERLIQQLLRSFRLEMFAFTAIRATHAFGAGCLLTVRQTPSPKSRRICL
jgi:hypothetical protein